MRRHISSSVSKFYQFLVPLTFIVLLGIYNYLMVRAYNYTIFDLGVSYRLLVEFHLNFKLVSYSAQDLISATPNYKLIYIPLSFTLYLWNNITMLLIDQILVIAAGGVAIYYIAFHYFHNKYYAMTFQVLYFLYPINYGFMTHGGNFMIYFAGFFLLAYVFLIYKKYILSFSFFILTAITTLWAPYIIALFLVLFIIETKLKPNIVKGQVLKDAKNWLLKPKFSKDLKVSLIFLVFFIIVSSISLIYFGYGGLLGISRISAQTSHNTSLFSPIYSIADNIGNYKLSYFEEVFSPLLFTSFFSIFALIPLFYILGLFSANYGPYYSLLQQYGYIIIPFIFISSILFFTKLRNSLQNKKALRKIIFLIIIASLFSFLTVGPFCIANVESGNVANNINVTTFDNELTHGLSLIPVNSSVYIQNSIPQMMNRNVVYSSGYYNFQNVDYSVIIPFGFSSLSDVFNGYNATIAHYFKTNSDYGLYEYIQGVLIYKFEYHGSLVYNVTQSESQLQ